MQEGVVAVWMTARMRLGARVGEDWMGVMVSAQAWFWVKVCNSGWSAA